MSKFAIPTVDEIFEYIKGKSGWPDPFCKFYSEKFWSHYEAQGWKLSNGNAMKNWQAAYNSNWQTLKYDSEKVLGAMKANVSSTTVGQNINARYRLFVEHGTEALLREEWIECYNTLKRDGLAKLPKEKIDWIVENMGNSRELGKAMSAYEIFKKYKEAGYDKIY